jgi:hypothetical protein
MMIRMPLLDVCKATLSLLIFPHLTWYIVLAAVKLRRVYGIQYPRDPDVRGDNTLGFTNMFFFFKEEASPLPQKPGNAWWSSSFFAMNEEIIEQCKETDGGWESFREDVANGRNTYGGWITKGGKSLLRIQKAYCRDGAKGKSSTRCMCRVQKESSRRAREPEG